MNLSLNEFCGIIKLLERSNAEKALAILWYHDHQSAGASMKAGELARVLDDHRVGTPNPTTLGRAIRSTRMATDSKAGFVLKPGSRQIIRGWLPKDIDGLQPSMDHSSGYLSEALWSGTRGYIEAVCRQLNGCFRFGYYDSASVMLRRLMETLIIEAYEHLQRESEIKGPDSSYLMLGKLVERANGNAAHKGLNLGRDAKKTLEDVKSLGDKSAHNRRFVAHAPDLTSIQAGVRTAVQELIQISNLKGNRSSDLIGRTASP